MTRRGWGDEEPIEFTDRPGPAVTAGGALRVIALVAVAALVVWCLVTLAGALLASARELPERLPERLPPCPEWVALSITWAFVSVGALASAAFAAAAWATRRIR